jgi:ankyrin repeat protein
MGEIHEAAARGDAERVRSLLAADPSTATLEDEHSKTPLHWAAEKNRVEVARLLIEAGAPLDRETTWGATPLEWAANVGSHEVAAVLLEHTTGRPSFWVAAALGLRDVVEAYLAGPTPESPVFHAHPHWPNDSAYAQGDSLSHAFVSASRNGHTDVAMLLLERGARLEAKGYFGGTALHWAAMNGHEATVLALLDRGASIEAKDDHFRSPPIGWAQEGGHGGLVRMLLDRGAQLDIWQAANFGLVDVVKRILDEDPSKVSALGSWGCPLHEAAFFGHLDVVALLLDRGAEIEARNTEGKTALEVAMGCKREAVAELLRARGAR